jgi:hypothetical protein
MTTHRQIQIGEVGVSEVINPLISKVHIYKQDNENFTLDRVEILLNPGQIN